MDIFISWQGKRSHAVAEALRDWLPLVVNAFKPWLSSADIDKGARWGNELASKLGSVTAGIFCLTPSNLAAPWLIFEAGAISRAPGSAYVCTLLVDLQPSDVKGPLAQFQATKTTKEDIHQLVKNLNKALGEQSMEDAHLDRSFEMWWPELEKNLKKLPAVETTAPPLRSDRELLEELIDLARATKANRETEMKLDALVAQLDDLRARSAMQTERLRQREADLTLHERRGVEFAAFQERATAEIRKALQETQAREKKATYTEALKDLSERLVQVQKATGQVLTNTEKQDEKKK